MDRNSLKIGVVADDFTGASDAASFLKKGGLSILLLNGTPSFEINLSGITAVVIALKTRSMIKEKAIELSMEAFEWLKKNNAEHIYSKYCSTFDSTREGNIGPVIDSVLDRYNYPFTIIVPSLPANGRVVKKGCIYVDGMALNESSMKNHPLTPMLDSRISNIMSPQAKYKCVELDREILYQDIEKIRELINYHTKINEKFYIIPDYIDENDALRIVQLFGNLQFMTGGSGLLEFLAKSYHKEYKDDKDTALGLVKGKTIILAGSVSQSTQSQVNYFIEIGKPSFKIEPDHFFEENYLLRIFKFISDNINEDVLIYSSDTPEKIKEYQKMGKVIVAKRIEDLFSDISKMAIKVGYSKIVVAGGETSGAVIHALGYNSFLIGESIAPGVPIMAPTDYPNIRLVLKSGNFGDVDFFMRALKLLNGSN